MAGETRFAFMSGAAIAYVAVEGWRHISPCLLSDFVPIMLSKVDGSDDGR